MPGVSMCSRDLIGDRSCLLCLSSQLKIMGGQLRTKTEAQSPAAFRKTKQNKKSDLTEVKTVFTDKSTTVMIITLHYVITLNLLAKLIGRKITTDDIKTCQTSRKAAPKSQFTIAEIFICHFLKLFILDNNHPSNSLNGML